MAKTQKARKVYVKIKNNTKYFRLVLQKKEKYKSSGPNQRIVKSKNGMCIRRRILRNPYSLSIK